MSDFKCSIIHFRFLNGDTSNPISMYDFRAMREEVALANHALEGESSLRINEPQLSPYGGYTVAVVSDEGRQWVGIAKCSPEDRFVRKIGVVKATGKARQAIHKGNVDPFAFIHGRADRQLVHYLSVNGLMPTE